MLQRPQPVGTNKENFFMKTLTAIVVFALAPVCFSRTTMNLEGNCTGTLKDGSAVAFSYYSDFDGCKSKSRAAIVYSEGGGLVTGSRSFKNGKDAYAFGTGQLSFKDFTGEVSGTLQTAEGESVPVQCQIRNYEYATEC